VLRSDQESVKDDEDNEYKVFEVVDGQQRLTTAVIFLNWIQREMERLKAFGRVPEGLRKNYLFLRDQNGQETSKLTLNRDCREFHETQILGLNGGMMVQGPTIRAHRLLQAADQYAQAHLAALAQKHGEAYPAALSELTEKLTKQLTLIVYEVDDEMDAAGLIFAAMNNRGQPLKQLDLVKNHVLYLSSRLSLEGENKLRNTINQTWKDVFERLAQIDDDDRHETLLLRYHWVATATGSMKPVNHDIIADTFSLKTHAANHLGLYQKLMDYLKTLRLAATAYRDICRPGHSDAFGDMRSDLRPQIKTVSQKLVRQGTLATFQPLLIAVRLKAQDQGETYLKVVDACERFAFRVYRWAGWQTRTGQSKIYGLAHQYYTGQRSGEDVIRSIVSWTLNYCPDTRFSERYDQTSLDWYRWAGIEYFLYEYEQHLAEQARVPVHLTWEGLLEKPKEESIEHILPQNPDDPYWSDRFGDKERARWTNDIGNLVLTFYNQSLWRHPFPKKRGSPSQANCYASSPYLSERELAAYADWSPAEIQQRREVLKVWSIARWQVAQPAPAASRPAVVTTGTRRISLESVRAQAEKYGLLAAYDTVMQVARAYHLHPVPHTWCVVMAPPKRHNCAVFTIWPGQGRLKIGFWYSQFKHYFHTTDAHVHEVMGTSQEYLYIDQANLLDFTGRLERLLSEIKLK